MKTFEEHYGINEAGGKPFNKNMIELVSGGAVLDTKTGNLYPVQIDDTYDSNMAMHIGDVDFVDLEDLDKTDKQTLNKWRKKLT